MGRTDSGSITIAAPAALVYAALVDPEALVGWLPPDGMTGRFEHVDIRPGGSYRMILTYRDTSHAPGKSAPDDDVADVRFIEIIPGRRIVQEVDFCSDDPAFAGTMTMTWELAATEGGTRVQVRAQHVPEGISAADHAAGIASSLANLARHVESATRSDPAPST
jgi:uncharacterized protein YndB with AHSA1/START domain